GSPRCMATDARGSRQGASSDIWPPCRPPVSPPPPTSRPRPPPGAGTGSAGSRARPRAGAPPPSRPPGRPPPPPARGGAGAPPPTPADVEEAITLEWPLDTIEPLLFVLRGLVERAVARLGLDGIGCARLGLALGLDDRSRDVRTLDLVAPTRDQKTLLTCLRVAPEGPPPPAPPVAGAVPAVSERVRATQLGLFAPPGPAPERLATTLARLGALCGPGRVGVPVVVDTHRPGAADVAAFAVSPAGLPDPATSPAPCR